MACWGALAPRASMEARGAWAPEGRCRRIAEGVTFILHPPLPVGHAHVTHCHRIFANVPGGRFVLPARGTPGQRWQLDEVR